MKLYIYMDRRSSCFWLICNICFLSQVLFVSSCKKMLQVDQPINVITTPQVFSSDQNASSAMAGIYSSMINAGEVYQVGFGNGVISIWCGTSADELIFFQNILNDNQFEQNQLQSSNTTLDAAFWKDPYSLIYSANSMISGLTAASGVTDSVANELIGESEVVRAFCNFYLVNLFRNVPLVTTTNYRAIADLANSAPSAIYQEMISDLKDAQERLRSDYAVAEGQRIVPNKYAAAALLARVYLYTGDWTDAVTEADTVIQNAGQYSLLPLNQVFLANSSEAIWQLAPNPNNGLTYNITPEASLEIPASATSFPFAYITSQLLNSFDSGDLRRTNWIDSVMYGGQYYYYPYKYKAGPSQRAAGEPVTENYMLLRLGEQFLIRAEAEAHGAGGGILNAISDLNMIRGRAGLGIYAGPTDSTDVLDSIFHERQVELFAEWGHRWLDLSRSGNASTVLSQISMKQPWSSNDLLYPIPYSELTVDPNLVQNKGY